MDKLGNGNNIDEMLRKYIAEVEEVASKNEEIVSYCKKLNEEMAKSIQKITPIRRNLYFPT